MLYKFQNDWNKNSKWLLTKKDRQKICTKKIVPKLYCNAEYLGLVKLMLMVKRPRQKYKQLQSICNLMYELEQVPKGVIQKQANVKWQ